MMDALEGVLEPAESAELQTYLSQNPDLAGEWEAMQSIDEMLRIAPPVTVPVNFVNSTVNRLPSARRRRLFMAAFYLALLLGGLVPFALGFLLSTQVGDASLGGQSIAEATQLLRVIGTGLLSALRTVASSQPIFFGWFALMLSIILTWAAVFRQYSGQVQPVLVPVNR